MVAIRNQDADAFIARPDPRRPIVLIFGPDLGLVRERTDALLRASSSDNADPFSTVTIDGDVLASDPGRLADEARTIGLFGGRRLVHVRAGSRNFGEALEGLLADPPKDALVVIDRPSPSSMAVKGTIFVSGVSFAISEAWMMLGADLARSIVPLISVSLTFSAEATPLMKDSAVNESPPGIRLAARPEVPIFVRSTVIHLPARPAIPKCLRGEQTTLHLDVQSVGRDQDIRLDDHA